MRIFLPLLLLAGCAGVPQLPPPPAAPAAPAVWCTLVTTLTTTIRAVYVQLGEDVQIEVSGECGVKTK